MGPTARASRRSAPAHPREIDRHAEVVIAALPELGSFALEEFRSLAFDDAQGGGERMEFWLGEEKVDGFGHENVAEEEELMTPADGFECLFEDDTRVIVV